MIRSLNDFFYESMQIPEGRWLVYGTILICAILIAIYVSVFFRNLALGTGGDDTDELLTRFREMRDQGQLDETEYSKLKKVIPDQAKPEALRSIGRTENPSGAGDEKKFLTLAEAESRKQHPEMKSEVNGNRQATDSE